MCVRRSASLSVFLLGFLSGTLALLVALRIADLTADPDERMLLRVQDLVGETFVDELTPSELVDRALSGLVDGLDDYSRFLTGDQVARLDRETTGLYRGIGVLFRPPARERAPHQILFALPDSPADEAGLAPGDRFLRVGTAAVTEREPEEVQRLLREADGARLALEVESLDGSVRTVHLEPRPIVDPSVRHGRLLGPDEGVGYLSIASFSRRTAGEFRAELDHLRDRGATSLIVDLRANPGGVLDAAVEIANLFVPEGTLVATRSRNEERVLHADPERATWVGLPLVVLVDGDSASASEVLAGALQDHRAAVLVGEPTYGKGVIQTLTRFPDDRAVVKITTSRYYTPAGRRIDRSSQDPHEHGISPDLLVEVTAEVRRAVHRHLLGYSPPRGSADALAAWAERESAPVVPAPPDDPQLDAAVGLLAGTLLSSAHR